MTTHGTRVRSTQSVWNARLGLVCSLMFSTVLVSSAHAQDDDEGYAEEESGFTVNALMKLQGGLFVPLASDGFSPHEHVAEKRSTPTIMGPPCDPVEIPFKPCYPSDHGQKPGTPSITRATLQLEAHWDFKRWVSLHAIVRGTRSMQLPADEYAQVPTSLDPPLGANPDDPAVLKQVGDQRRKFAKKWVQEEQYNTLELREFYADVLPTDWLAFRIGRQQVAWGETGSFRLLDVVNPINSIWHFGPLESFEDQRVPLWMLLTTVDITALAGALELLYIPGVDRSRDTVSTPLSMGGAWGVPYSNQPGTYRIHFKDFQYPGGELHPDNMRYGARWKGDIGDHVSYSLVYMYTHMQAPVLYQAILRPQYDMMTNQPIPGFYDSTTADRAIFRFPRQHIMGLSGEYAFPSPIGATLRFEGAFEPNRTYSQRTDSAGDNSVPGFITYTPETKPVVNYAFVLQRPTMIRWLNPVQNFLLVAQFQHTAVLNVDEVEDSNLVQVVGYNDWRIQKNSYTLVFFATTQYFNGIFVPRLTGVYIPNPYYQDSGFVSLDLGFRIGPHYRVNVSATDFVGKNAYRDIGLFRDRDEVHASLTVLF